jgi:hypothetical protein
VAIALSAAVLVLLAASSQAWAVDQNKRLLNAAQAGDLKAVKKAIDRGADVNAVNERKSSALLMAAGSGNFQIVKLLVEHGVDVNLRNTEGVSALMTAAANGSLKIINYLLDHGANAAFRDSSGNTAARVAEINDNERAAGILHEAAASSAVAKSQLANPASVNCGDKGGTLIIQHNPLGEYGVCVFEDNRQCEEWAMFRGECPVGGVKITGYTTPGAVYCAITGGSQTIEKDGRTMCTKDGVTCPAEDYLAGKCRKK